MKNSIWKINIIRNRNIKNNTNSLNDSDQNFDKWEKYFNSKFI